LAGERAPAADNGKDFVGLNALLTIYGDGKINLNTALPAVLKALPFLSEAAQNEILSRRQLSVNQRFTTREDIRSNSAFTLTDKTVLLQVARFNSDHFQLHIRIRSEQSASLCEYAACLERNGRTVRVLNWQRKLPRVPGDDLDAVANPG
jgi:hypothetical protein